MPKTELCYSKLNTPQKKLVELFFNNQRKYYHDIAVSLSGENKGSSLRKSLGMDIMKNFMSSMHYMQLALLGLNDIQRKKGAKILAGELIDKMLNEAEEREKSGSYTKTEQGDWVISDKAKKYDYVGLNIFLGAFKSNREEFLFYLKKHTEELILQGFNEERIIEQAKNLICEEYYSRINQEMPISILILAKEYKNNIYELIVLLDSSGINPNNSTYWFQIEKWAKNSEIAKSEKINPGYILGTGFGVITLGGALWGASYFVAPLWMIPVSIASCSAFAVGINKFYKDYGTYIPFSYNKAKQLQEEYNTMFFRGQSTHLVKSNINREEGEDKAVIREDKTKFSPSIAASQYHEQDCDFVSTMSFLSAPRKEGSKPKNKTHGKPDEKAAMIPDLKYDEPEEFYTHKTSKGEKFKVVREMGTSRYFCISKTTFDSYEERYQKQIIKFLEDAQTGRGKRIFGTNEEFRNRIKIGSSRLFMERIDVPEGLDLPSNAELLSISSKLLTHDEQDRKRPKEGIKVKLAKNMERKRNNKELE